MLHDLINGRRDEIAARARRIASQRATGGSDIELDESMTCFLEQLSEALRLSHAQRNLLNEEARAHGARSVALGLSVSQVVHRYGDICQAVTALAFELAVPIAADEFGAFNQLLDEAIASALVEYEVQREAVILRKGDERAVSLALTFQDGLSMAMAASSALTIDALNPDGSMESLLDQSLRRLQVLIEPPVEERDGARALARERVFLGGVIQEATLGASIDASRRGVAFFVVLPGAFTAVWVDRRLLINAVSKIVCHVLQITPPGGRVAVNGRGETGRAWIEVETRCALLPFEDSGARYDACEQRRGRHRDLVRQLWPNVRALGAQLALHEEPERGYVFTLALRTFVEHRHQSRSNRD